MKFIGTFQCHSVPKQICEDFCPVCIPVYLCVEILSYKSQLGIPVYAARSAAHITKLLK